MNVLLIGGSGYVGTHIARQLLRLGHGVTVLSRRGKGPLGAVRYMAGNAASGEGLAQAVAGQDAVIYLAGIIREKGRQTYRMVHVDGVRNTLEAAKQAGVKRYLHMSALGADPHSKSRYSATKGEAEALVRASGLDWTIFRPSLIFGEGDDFFGGVLKGLVTAPAPVIPQIGNGQFPYRPIWVGDVAACFEQALHKPSTMGQTYALVGPKEYSFRELLLAVRDTLGLGKPLFPIPLPLMDLMIPLMSLVPFSPLTGDLYTMLKAGNTADPTKMRQVFKLEERSLESELPRILEPASPLPANNHS
jgi:NADH dehydrogenase